jgi:hypothetical protein
VGLSLIAFDTNHIKRYVFATNKLKEIRGASSLLDYLNRSVMCELADKHHATRIYANGGSGLFRIATERAEAFGQAVQREYSDRTGGSASITYVHVPLPEGSTGGEDEDVTATLKLLQWRLQEKGLQPPDFIALPSHPFMRICDACGSEYASPEEKEWQKDAIRDSDEQDELSNELYCESCQKKRLRDLTVKNFISRPGKRREIDEPLWSNLIERLQKSGYDLLPGVDRPSDFNDFTNFKGEKDYLGLIYADANNMGKALQDCITLPQRKEFADRIDNAIYDAVCAAIVRHLRIEDHLKPGARIDHPILPFDILLLGGDDVVMVVPASVALDVALTIAREFRHLTNGKHTLSAGVVLAPVKYPFGLLRSTAESTLKFAKKKSAEARARANGEPIDDTHINFMVVTGGSDRDFKSVYDAVYHKKYDKPDPQQEFYATLRPYAPNDLDLLLKAIRGGHKQHLGRTKLHQMREAVLEMNLTTAVIEGMALLTNWREKQRNYVVQEVYEFGKRYQLKRCNPRDPASGFPQVTFPWFKDGTNQGRTVYRTSLLDFVELYDFLSREVENGSDEH